MRTIKIAPDKDEVIVKGSVVTTEFNGMGITYTNDNVRLYKEDIVKAAMQMAIAMSSKSWQIKGQLDDYFEGQSTFEAKEI